MENFEQKPRLRNTLKARQAKTERVAKKSYSSCQDPAAEEIVAMLPVDCSFETFMGILKANLAMHCQYPTKLIEAYLKAHKLTKEQASNLKNLMKEHQIYYYSNEATG